MYFLLYKLSVVGLAIVGRNLVHVKKKKKKKIHQTTTNKQIKKKIHKKQKQSAFFFFPFFFNLKFSKLKLGQQFVQIAEIWNLF